MQSNDDEQMQQIKTAFLRNIVAKFHESNAIKLFQDLDPETKQLVLRQDATRLLEEAIRETVICILITLKNDIDGIHGAKEGSICTK